jgi:predicted lipoprotein with Yx(FWY)xxD motif
MERRYSIVAILMALTLLLSACGPQAAGARSAYNVPAAAQLPAATQASAAGAPAHVALGKTAQFGSILVDAKGMTLYLYTKDTPNTSACYGKCATAWPPLLTSGAAVGGDGLDASKFGTTNRTDGTVQVTYNSWPLYYFAKDKQPGDTTGQNVGSVWYLVSPSGDAIK